MPTSTLTKHQLKARIELARRASRQPGGFRYFIYNVFSASFDNFVGGEYIDEVAEVMTEHAWTIDVTGRDHFKSTRLYAEIMYDIFTCTTDIEGHYFSFNIDMSRYHIKKLKQMIKRNPFFAGTTDLNILADSIIEYHNGRGSVRLYPQGMGSFKRGIHADRIYIDDPLKDPENKLAPVYIHRVNRIVKTELYPMVNKGGKCRVVGTPQTNEDFFFDEQVKKRWHVRVLDAMKDEAKRIALWPQWKTFDELVAIRQDIGEKTFNQEYRCKPAYTEDSYIERSRLILLVNPDLRNQREYTGANDVVGGFDIGKHTHPAHLTLFERFRREYEVAGESVLRYHYRQLLSQWLDKWDYNKQVEYLTEIVNSFNLSILRYDGTRGEYEAFAEQGKLPKEMKPVMFSTRTKNAMAVNLDSIVTGERVEFINDQRQIRQMLAVTSDLQAFESSEGHGDSFWSNGMALLEEREKTFRVRTV